MTSDGKFSSLITENRTDSVQGALHTDTFQGFSGGLTNSQKGKTRRARAPAGKTDLQHKSIKSVCLIAAPGSRRSSSGGADGRMKVKDGCRGRAKRKVGALEKEEEEV